jgi:hypothetical protein
MASADSMLAGTIDSVGEHLITRLDLLECRLLAKIEELERRFVMWTGLTTVLAVALAFAAGRFV